MAYRYRDMVTSGLGGYFCDFSSRIIKNRPFCFDPGLYHLPFPRYDHFRSGVIFGIFSSKFIKNKPFYCWLWASVTCRCRDSPLRVSGNFVIFRQRIIKIRHFTVGSTCLSLDVTEIRPLPVLGDFLDCRQNHLK
jgi:hypothetical protein